MLRLLRLTARKYADAPSTKGGPKPRHSSPSGDSILMTSAPWSPSIWPQNGPARTREASMTRRPASAPPLSLLCIS